VIEKKDGTKIGLISHYVIPGYGWMEIGPVISPKEADKGYGTEAMQIMVDYLFLTTDIMRITELTDVRNVAAQKCYEKVGFKKEGTIRKARYYRGEWADHYIFGILREDWKEPRILTKISSTH
jgi:ribosomal-protein-alanine N-acetyltransferase